MATYPDYRQRPPGDRGVSNRPALSSGTNPVGYSSNGRAMDYSQNDERSKSRQPPYQRTIHNAQEEYTGYNQNPWSTQNDGYDMQTNAGRPSAYKQDDTLNDEYYLPPNPNTGRARWEEQRNAPAPGRRTPAQNKPEVPVYGQRSDSAYGTDEGMNDAAQSRQAPSQHTALPFRDRDQGSARRPNEEDQLPRYMNGHAHRFSHENHQKGTSHYVDPYTVNYAVPPPSNLTVPPEFREQNYQQGPNLHSVPRKNDLRAWDNPFPSVSASSKERPQEQPMNVHPSNERSGYEPGQEWQEREHANSPYQQNSIALHGPSNGGFDFSDTPRDFVSAPSASKYPGTSSFERSRTMPAAISDSAPESGLIPADDHLKWQEPGAVSGYYGPETDTKLTRETERYGASRPREPSRSQSDDPHWVSNEVARPVQTEDPRKYQIPTESRGEILNSSQDRDYHSDPNYGRRRPSAQRPQPHDVDMPNFDTTAHHGLYGRDMSVEDHLRPQAHRSETEEPIYSAHEYDRHEPYQGHQGDMPRSRSQPDFSGPPPRLGQQQGVYDPGGPHGGPLERPATSASARDYGQHPSRSGYGPRNGPYGPPGPGVPNRSHWGPPGSVPGQGYGPRNRHRDPNRHPNNFRKEAPPGHNARPPHDRTQLPAPRSHPPMPGRRPDDGAPYADRHRSPPVQNGRTQPDPRGPISHHQQSRSPPAAHNGEYHEQRSFPSNGAQEVRAKNRHPSLDKPLPNPDALPSHPAPVRPGLLNGQASGSNTRPVPVRQYDSARSGPVQQPDTSNAARGRSGLGVITPQELENLKQQTARHPNDNPTQFLLAQKLAEAADVLVDERADPGMRKRNRERYQSDALKIIKKLSALSYGDADFFYADCYSRGALGLQPDIKEAFLLYQKAAKANHAQAAYRVAVCCELGQEDGGGTKRDPIKAMQWYRRAATLGDTAAMYKMGVILLKGLLGQPRNPPEGISWLRQAAERADKENPHALHELALLHEKPNSTEGIRHDEGQSRRLFTQAANLGYKFSQFRLGCAYEYGLIGCAVDPRQSIAWYSKAAVQEEHQSELALSGWYLTGSDGILQQSDTEAYLWARKAAQAGMAKAEYAMGYFTEVGIGAPANLEDAKRWYWKSASQNFPKARDRLEDLRRGGGPKQKTRVSRSNMRKQSDGECVVM